MFSRLDFRMCSQSGKKQCRFFWQRFAITIWARSIVRTGLNYNLKNVFTQKSFVYTIAVPYLLYCGVYSLDLPTVSVMYRGTFWRSVLQGAHWVCVAAKGDFNSVGSFNNSSSHLSTASTRFWFDIDRLLPSSISIVSSVTESSLFCVYLPSWCSSRVPHNILSH